MAHNSFHIEEGKDAASVMRLRAAGKTTLNFSRTGTDAPATQRVSKMFIHYHFRRRARSRVLTAAVDKPPLICTNAKIVFRVTQTNLWHIFLENMTSLVVQVVGGDHKQLKPSNKARSLPVHCFLA